MEKSADAFRTISEVADDLALPQHVLRFWETRFPQIRPLKRAGGRRYYRPADVSLLKAVRQLLYDDGYTIKGVQRLLKEQGAKGLSAGLAPAVLDWDPTIEGSAGGDAEDIEPAGLVDQTDGPAHGPMHGHLHDNRRAIQAALTTVDECKRILDALLSPSR